MFLLKTKRKAFLAVRCYAGAGTSYGPVSVCLSVRPSVRLSQVGSRCMNGLIWFLPTSPTLCFKEIQVSTKIRVLPSGRLFRKLWT